MGGCLLSELTTLRLGGPAADIAVARSAAELVDCVQDADAAGADVLFVAGGSNLVVADEGFDGRTVRVRSTGFQVDHHNSPAGYVTVTVSGGQDWDEFVAYAVTQEWSGIEALSGIPGSVGATPIQNVGAYGQDVAQSIKTVHTWDRTQRRYRSLAAGECDFSYRSSRFKANPAQFVVLSVTFELAETALSPPVAYAELATSLGIETGQPAPSQRVRDAVLELRRAKGMVLDPADHDTWSAGSFFTNPIIAARDAETMPAGAPQFTQPDGSIKTSAAWLIERAGFGKGFGNDRVRVSGKHTLALTNRGTATTDELLALARTIRAGVAADSGITLTNEPVLVSCAL